MARYVFSHQPDYDVARLRNEVDVMTRDLDVRMETVEGTAGAASSAASSALAVSTHTVQTLELLKSTTDGVEVGDVRVVVSGSKYICATATASGSTWEPVSGWWNVLDFGAVGDGVADDTDDIQDALDKRGRTYFPGNTYLISSSLIIDTKNYLKGDGRQKTLIKAVSMTDSMIRRTSTASSSLTANRSFDMVIEDLWLDNTTAAAGSVGIDLSQCTDCVVRNTFVGSCETGHKLAHFCYYNRLDTCTSSNCTTGFHIYNGANDNTLTRARCSVVTDGYHFEEGPDGAVNNCSLVGASVEGFTGRALWFDGTTAGLIIANSVYNLRAENSSSQGTGIDFGAAAKQNAVYGFFPQNAATKIAKNASASENFVSAGNNIRARLLFFSGLTENAAAIQYSSGATAFQIRNAGDTGYEGLEGSFLRAVGTTAEVIAGRLRMNEGTTLVPGDFSLTVVTPGWGDAATVTNVLGEDSRCSFRVNSLGASPAADPVIRLTFSDGAYANTPFVIAGRNGDFNEPQVTVPLTVETVTSTYVDLRWHGTPVIGESYNFTLMVMG
jgi:hypothetical protein